MNKRKVRKILIMGFKLLLSAALLWWVLRKVDGEEFSKAISQLDYRLLAVSAAGFLLSVLIIVYRWWRLLEIQQIRISLWESTRLTFLGTFCNYIVFGTTGGDLVKAYYVSKHTDSKTVPLVTVIVDRLLGLTGLTLLSAIMLAIFFTARNRFPAGREYDDAVRAVALLIVVVLASLTGGCVVVFSRRLRRWLRLEKLAERLPLARQFMRANRVLHRYRAAPLAMSAAMGYTLLAHLAFVGAIAALGFSMHLAIPWYMYVVFVPAIYIIAAMPISLGGIGLAESSYVAFLSLWAGQSELLALALLVRLMQMFWALPGVVVLMTGPKIPPVEQLQAEMSEPAEPAEQSAKDR